MPDETATSSDTSSSVPVQLTNLVPRFDPASDDLEQYAHKIEMLSDIWPPSKLNELMTRLILQTTGAAFQKLQLQRKDILTNDKKGVQRLVAILGGHWGRVDLEKKYDIIERALFKCIQKQDESNDSYLARADVLWTELLAKQLELRELRAYIVLRGSQLSPDDRKRVIIESNAEEGGTLDMERVSRAVRMLGSSFFHDVTGQKRNKGKVYDALTCHLEDDDEEAHLAMVNEEINEEEYIEALAQDGDEDAVFVSEYETSIQDAIQEDVNLAAAFTSYTEARKRLSERSKNRGFWAYRPSAPQKGKGRPFKGKGKGGGSQWGKGHRKSLQQRILESNCRLCGQGRMP